MTRPITIALGKGRILKTSLPLLEKINIRPSNSLETTRKLLINTNHPQINLIVVRSTDLPTYVRYGVASLGIVGKDVLMEQTGSGFYELIDFKVCRCRLMLAAKAGLKLEETRHLKVASKFIHTTQNWFSQKGISVDMIKLHGAMELAVISGLADAIVDLVDTGSTLKANNLVAYDSIAEISARLIINSIEYKHPNPLLKQLLQDLSSLS